MEIPVPSIKDMMNRTTEAKRMNKTMDTILEQHFPGIVDVKNMSLVIRTFKDFESRLKSKDLDTRIASVELDLYYIFNHLLNKVDPPEPMRRALKEIIGD